MYGEDYEWLGRYGDAGREGFFDNGHKHAARLAASIETLTGAALESRRALDFGCGVGRVSLPLAERCEHVYGVDVSPGLLREADQNARDMNLSNVEWVEAGRLAELSGQYDMVVSMFVFQHIPRREGERIFATLLQGLRPGGVGNIHLTIRPSHPPAVLLGVMRSALLTRNPFHQIRGWVYMLARSYSLNRLARLLADAGVTEWYARFTPGTAPAYDAVNIIFRKDLPAEA